GSTRNPAPRDLAASASPGRTRTAAPAPAARTGCWDRRTPGPRGTSYRDRTNTRPTRSAGCTTRRIRATAHALEAPRPAENGTAARRRDQGTGLWIRARVDHDGL